MTTYIVERYLAGWSTAEVDALLARMDELMDRFAADGVRYLRSIVLTGDETCLSLFEGPDPDQVRAANAELPTHRVVAAHLTAPHGEVEA